MPFCEKCGAYNWHSNKPCVCKPWEVHDPERMDMNEVWRIDAIIPEDAAEKYCKRIGEHVAEYFMLEGETVTVHIEGTVYEVEAEQAIEYHVSDKGKLEDRDPREACP